MACIQCHFSSKVLGLSSTMNVILPQPAASGGPGAGGAGGHRFPTLYLLHGLSDDHTIWQRRTSIERYVEGLDLAVVMPAVDRSFYADTRTGQRYWTFVSEELPFLARSFFPLSDAREDNFVAGLSMGGYGAFKLALTHPDRYAAAASLSGALDIVSRARTDEESGTGELRRVFGKVKELEGGPNDLFHLAEQMARRKDLRPALYQWCGTEDFLYADNVCFRKHAKRLKLAVAYEEGPGGHEWACWDRQIQKVLAWLPGIRKR
jgi:putative tributyrin esterase